MQSPSENAGGVPGELRSDAEQLSTSASNRIHREIDDRKGTVAEQARSVSAAIQRTASELNDGAPEWLKSAFRQGAQQVQRLADSLDQKDSGQIMSDIQTLARNNPASFLLGCAALGFAAARIFKAGAPAPGVSPAQSRQTQLPPVQGEEPMLRSSGAGVTASPSRAGEVV